MNKEDWLKFQEDRRKEREECRAIFKTDDVTKNHEKLENYIKIFIYNTNSSQIFNETNEDYRSLCNELDFYYNIGREIKEI